LNEWHRCRLAQQQISIGDPRLCGIFQQALEQTRKHFAIVNAEYMRDIGMVDGSGQDLSARD
jgi:hypothetical protein